MAEWNENKIAEMIRNKIEEGSDLDWKNSDSLNNCKGQKADAYRDELSKDVSCFANAAGGKIIYGVIEERDPPHRPVGFDNGCDPAVITKEFVDDLVSSRINPPIFGVSIHPVELKSTNPGRVAYVIEISQSHTVHQARDNKYYRRRNFKSEPMEDYEVREGMLRTRSPLINVEFRHNHIPADAKYSYEVHVILKNVGAVRAHDLMFQMEFPNSMYVSPQNPRVAHDATISKEPSMYRGIPHCRLGFRSNGHFVLFPTERMELSKHGFLVNLEIGIEHFGDLRIAPFLWRVYADDAAPRSGEQNLYDFFNDWNLRLHK